MSTIGPFTNVPEPGAPLQSAWAQQLTQYVNDKFVSPPKMVISTTSPVSVPDNVNSLIPCNTETADTHNMHSSGAAAQFTIPAGYAGRWHLEIFALWAASDTGIIATWLAFAGNVAARYCYSHQYHGHSTAPFATTTSTEMLLGVGDFFHIYALSDTPAGSARTVDMRVSAFFVGP